MSNRDVWQLIQTFNRQRDPELVRKKYSKLAGDAFSFFRGTCHLFYQDLPSNLTDRLAPNVWICGDLHLENFGTYKGDDRQIYFGINDFDESALAPCTWDLARLSTSIFLAADNLKLEKVVAVGLVQSYLTSYSTTLKMGRSTVTIEENTGGAIAELIDSLRHRKRVDLLNERTELIKDRRQLKFDKGKILKIDKQRREDITLVINEWAKTQSLPEFFEVLDVGFRLAGIGSLGLDRYLILVTGEGSPDRNYLLDFKQQPNSALQPYLTVPQPPWTNQATRVMRAQQLVQSSPPALLAAIPQSGGYANEYNNSSYLLRELQPTADKLSLEATARKLSHLGKTIEIMAQVTAAAHLHGSGKLGASSAEDLITFGSNLDWQQQILIYAKNYAERVRSDYHQFKLDFSVFDRS
jgi:uncharacterized protein (DUF2252 family)